MTDEERYNRVLAMVKRIYRAVNDGRAPVMPSGTELAEQHYACVLAAAGLYLKAHGWTPWSEGGDEMVNEIARAAAGEMERAFERGLIERN